MSAATIKQLERLFHRFQPVLVAYARQYLRSEEDAREVVQDVFMGVWNNRDHLRYDDSLKPYLFTATRNRALNYLRRNRGETVSLEAAGDHPGAVASEGEAALFARETRALIFDEINRLPERCREIFLLSRQEGLSYREIAEKLNVSAKTVENQISIALKRLRERVFDEDENLRLGPGILGLGLALSLFFHFFGKKLDFLWGWLGF